MLNFVFLTFSEFFLALVYRLRGGGFIQFGGDTPPRLIWSVAFTLVLAGMYHMRYGFGLHDLYLGLAIPLAFAAVAFVPHAFAQQMGRSALPSSSLPLAKRWPQAWMHQATMAEWVGMTENERFFYDFDGMLNVGFFRGLLVFTPLTPLSHSLWAPAAAVLTITIFQAIAYSIGWEVIITLPSLKAHSTEWCEFFNGMAWALAAFVFMFA